MRDAMILAGAGVCAGALLSWATTRWLSTLLYGVETTDALTYAAVILLFGAIAAAAAFVPARKAAAADPVQSLRGD